MHADDAIFCNFFSCDPLNFPRGIHCNYNNKFCNKEYCKKIKLQPIRNKKMNRIHTFDLLMTDDPDLVRVAVVAPIGNSDHSSLWAVISMAQAVLDLCVSRKVFLKHQVNWNTVCGAMHAGSALA